MQRPKRVPSIRGGRVDALERPFYPRMSGKLESFWVYLNIKDRFRVEFEQFAPHEWSQTDLDLSDGDGILDDPKFKGSEAFRQMYAVYVASHACGVSEPDFSRPGMVGSLLRFHVFFTAWRLLQPLSKLSYLLRDRDVIEAVWSTVPTRYRIWDRGTGRVCKLVERSPRDFHHFVAKRSATLTRLGKQVVQASVYTYAFCLLSAQAINGGRAITGTDGVNAMVQRSFMEKVKDRVMTNDSTDSIIDKYTFIVGRYGVAGRISVADGIEPAPSNLNLRPAKPAEPTLVSPLIVQATMATQPQTDSTGRDKDGNLVDYEKNAKHWAAVRDRLKSRVRSSRVQGRQVRGREADPEAGAKAEANADAEATASNMGPVLPTLIGVVGLTVVALKAVL